MMTRRALSSFHCETESNALSGGMATRVQPLKDSSGRISIHPEVSDGKAFLVCAHSVAESRNEIVMIKAQRDFIPAPPQIRRRRTGQEVEGQKQANPQPAGPPFRP